MRRGAAVWFVPLLLLAAMVAAAPSALGSVRSGGGLVSGQSVTASIGTAGDSLVYTFGASAGQHVDVDVTASNWSTADGAALTWTRPDGSSPDPCNVGQGAKPCDLTADVTGTWTLAIEPADQGTGQLTFTYLSDQDLGSLTANAALTTTFGAPGQNALYRFAGTSGRRVLFNVTAFNLGAGGSARLSFTAPDGTPGDYCVLTTAPDSCSIIPNATGTWTVSLDPTDSDTGVVTFVYGPDQLGGELVAGKTVTATIATANQNATYTFAATAGRPISFTVSATNWISSAPTYLYFFAPAASALFSHCTAAVDVDCRLTPNHSGTWRLTVSASGSTGDTTFTYLPDLNQGKLTRDKAVTTRITTVGQNAAYTFAATKGKAVKLLVKSSKWSKGSIVRLYVFPPSGSPLFDSCSVSKKTTCTTVPDAGGTWRLELDPQGDATGHLTIERR